MDDAADHPPVIDRATPRTLSGSIGRSRSNCSSLNQKITQMHAPALAELEPHIPVARAILIMG
jgi:hypothetical protein